MDWQYTIYIISVFSACVITASVAIYTWRHRDIQGAMTFFWLTLLATWFSVTEGLSLVSHTPATALFWFNARFIGLAGMPVAWFAFALQYTDRQRWLTTQRVVGLVATPLVTQMIIWTNDAHGLWIQKHVGFFQAGPFMIADTGMRIPGLWFWVHITYSYSLTLLAILLLALVAIRSFHLYREQAVALWLGVFFILTGTAVPTFHLIPGLKINPIVPSIACSCLMVAWTIFRYRLFDVIPIARDTLIDSMDEAMLVVDAQDRIVDLNPAMLKILSRALKADTDMFAKQLIGKPAKEVFSPWQTFFERFRENTQIRTEIAMEHEETHDYYDLQISSLTDQHGRLTGRLIVLHNITPRRQAEEALRESEQKFRELTNLLPQTVFEMDLHGRYTYTNQQGFDMTGYTREDLEAGLTAFQLIIPDDHERVKQNMAMRLRGIRTEPSEYTLVRKDGRTFPVLIYSAPIIRNHHTIGLRGAVIDMTHLKQLEEQLLQSQKMEAVGQLAGGIAHDFNTLLGIILGYGEMMRDDIPEETLLRENLEEIINAGSRAKALVRQLLDFARPSTRDRHPIRLASLVEDAARLLRSSLPTTIIIQQHIETESPMVRANSTQIAQTIMNLGMNAGDAIGEQGGIITISLAKVEVDEGVVQLQAVKPGAYVRLHINDTGCGMNPETLEHIFEPFFTTKKVGEGSGLGLSVAHGIVKSHGGFITVESEPGKGSTFQVYLPTIDD